MKPNIFWRAARRQPVRMMLLLSLTALMVFTFTVRAAEYLLVQQETNRLGSYYKATGRISRLSGATTAGMASFEEAKEFLENDPRVAYISWSWWLTGALQDMYNADIYGYGASDECIWNTRCFTGTLLGISELKGNPLYMPDEGGRNPGWVCFFRQERSLAGAPELVREGNVVKVYISRDDAPAVLDMLTVGEQYLMRGQAMMNDQVVEDVLNDKGGGFIKWKRPAGEPQYSVLPLAAGGPLFYHVPESGEIDWNDPVLAGVEEAVGMYREEQGAMLLIATRDMESMKDTQPDESIRLAEGRWLNYEDHARKKKVCVIHEEMAKVRGLSIGDTITLKLRDLNAGYTQHGYLLSINGRRIPPYQTATETFQIVGTYNTVRPYVQGTGYKVTVMRNYMYIPDSAVPEYFENFENFDKQRFTAGSLTFGLISPEATEEFLAGTRDALAEMTLQANMWENGWEAFQEAVRPIRHASLYNLEIFTLILLMGLCVTALFYFQARRRDTAIGRALGVPAGVCVRQGALPLLLIGFAGTLAGGCLGWQYVLRHGVAALATLDNYGDAAEITLPYSWLAALLGGVLVVVFALAFGGMAWLAHCPTLTLLQGNAQTRQKEEKTARLAALDAAPGTAETAGAGPVPMSGTFLPVLVQSGKRSLNAAHTLRFVGRYIRRSKAKSLLVLLLAALFTVGLSAIRISILNSGARMDDLFSSISVELTLMPKSSTDYVMGGGFAAQRTVDHIKDTGFARGAYLESQCAITRIRREDVFLADGGSEEMQSEPRDGDTGRNIQNGPTARMLSFSDLDRFLSTGSGSEAEITYYEGWDAEMFAKDWSDSDTLPVLMPASLCEALNIPENGHIVMEVLWEDIAAFNDHFVEVAGTYTGTLTVSKWGDGTPFLLAPAGVMEAVMQGHTAYSTARFALDPVWNRDFDTVRAAVEEITEAPAAGLIPLRPVVWDEELKQAVEPLENSIRLMEMLFPVALTLSLLAAAGVSALMILTEAREAAIMRVLGATKLRCRIILSLQVIFMVLGGLMIGMAAVLAWAGRLGLAWATAGMSAICAAAYLLCATAGSTAGAVAVTNRPPLELLQVKE